MSQEAAPSLVASHLQQLIRQWRKDAKTALKQQAKVAITEPHAHHQTASYGMTLAECADELEQWLDAALAAVLAGQKDNDDDPGTRVAPSVPCVAPTGSTAEPPMGAVTADERTEQKLLLEVKLVAYALLGFRPGQKWNLRPAVQECVEAVIEMVESKYETRSPDGDGHKQSPSTSAKRQGEPKATDAFPYSGVPSGSDVALAGSEPAESHTNRAAGGRLAGPQEPPPQHDLPAEAAKVLRDNAWQLTEGAVLAAPQQEIVASLVAVVKAFLERFRYADDKGPPDEGWQSKEFAALIAEADGAVVKAEQAAPVLAAPQPPREEPK